MSDKRRNLILLKILGQIQQDNEDARDGMEKSIGTVCNEEGISFGQVKCKMFLIKTRCRNVKQKWNSFFLFD